MRIRLWSKLPQRQVARLARAFKRRLRSELKAENMKTSLSFGVGVTLGLLSGLLLGLRLRFSDGEGSLVRDLGATASSHVDALAPSSDAQMAQVELPARLAVESRAAQLAAPAPEAAPLRERFAALQDALAHHPPWTGDTSALEAKYAGLSDADKVLADYALRNKLEAERDRICAELLRAGECEVQRFTGDAPVASLKTGPRQPMQSGLFSCENSTSGMVFKSAVIDPVRFPQFHALEMECWWLGTHLRHEGVLKSNAGIVQVR